MRQIRGPAMIGFVLSRDQFNVLFHVRIPLLFIF